MPVTLVLSIRNMNPRSANVCVDRGGAWVYDEAGKPVPLTPKGLAAWPYFTVNEEFPRDKWLGPGCALAEKFPLDELFDLSRPGKYTVFAGHACSAIRELWVGANAGTLEIQGSRLAQGRDPALGVLATYLLRPGLIRTMISKCAVEQREGVSAGRSRNNLTLDAAVSPVDRYAVDLVVSLKNVCTSGRVANRFLRLVRRHLLA